MTKFTDITLPEPILRAVSDLNFTALTTIQELTIPWLLDNDSDLIAIAQTGTGKTAAFGIPALTYIDIEKPVVQVLVLCPTRELCLQITKDFTNYSKYMPRIKTEAIYGGAPIYKQKEALNASPQIVVGTPGRVLDMIRQGALKLSSVSILILDEADEMLNMGFKDDIFEIMSSTPDNKQSLLFSATMPKEVSILAHTFMKSPHRISAGNENIGAENILHYYYKVHARDKYLALKRIADMSPKIYGIIFCRTRSETQDYADKLQHDGYNADALHGDLSQGQRELVMSRFRSKFVKLLVATDVAARGLDVDDLTHIINMSPPTDPDIYIHRSGRTGRAGKKGISITIVHSKEYSALKAAEKRLGKEIQWQKVPGGREICEKQLFHFVDTVERIEVNQDEIASFLGNVYKKLSWMTREELIQRFISVEFNRFLNYYKDIPDLDAIGETRAKVERGKVSFKTFKLNLGTSQDLSKREIMRYINQLNVTRGIEIGHIEIFNDHTLIELDAEYELKLLKAFSRNKYKGIQVKAEIVERFSTRKKTYVRSDRKDRKS
ncbi:MAG: DEAD/DEAH box helicase [Candidatus Cloacimonetes bacterium]|nr:DEAD/DEAH box helicase [Candidatus Cloacimonadota bacterium]